MNKKKLKKVIKKGARWAIENGFGTAQDIERIEDKGQLEYFAEKNYKNDILRIGLPDHFIEHGTQQQLHHLLKIDPEGIAEKVLKFVDKKVIKNGIVA